MLNVIYRFCNLPCLERHNRPEWFSKINCFESIYQNFIENDIRLYCVQDGDDGPLTDFIKSKNNITEFINIKYKSNSKSLNFCLELPDKIPDGDLYFVEDDFLHTKNCKTVLLEGIKNFELVTLFDHLDRYQRTDDITQNCESIHLTESSYWRTCESTTCTWACSKFMWNKIKNDAIIHNLNDRMFFRHLIEKKIRLWSPIKSCSTHCDINGLAPLVDWRKINNSYVIDIVNK